MSKGNQVSDIKITGGSPLNAGAVDEVTASPKMDGTSSAVDEAAGASDAVGRIAEDLVAGRINGDQAIDRLIEETLGGAMVAGAPAEMRSQLEQVLRAYVETDPHLKALALGIGASGE
jgi:hypothetical protein